MTTLELDILTDKLAKTDSAMFPVADKLLYYNIAYGIACGLIIDEGQDTFEAEETKTTVAGERDYLAPARIHTINWLKINYGSGFIPATYKSEADLIKEFGDILETTLTNWPVTDPIYYYKANSIFISPTPTASQAGTDRLWASMELLPDDLEAGGTPLIPSNFHYILAFYAAFMYHDENGEDSQALKRKKLVDEGLALMIKTMFPEAREAVMIAHITNEDGSDL